MAEDDTDIEFPDSGRLRDYPLPHLLGLGLEARLTGMLHVTSGDTNTWVCFDSGHPVGVHVPNSEVFLGMVLRELGFIDDQTFNESLMRMAKSNKLQGEVLLEMGKLTEEQLDEALRIQVMRKLTQLFALLDGNFFYIEDDQMPEAVKPMRVHPYRVIYNGIKSNYHEDELEELLGEMLAGKSCRHADGYPGHKDSLALPGDEAADVDLLAKPRRPGEFIQAAQTGPVNALMLLAVLHHCGLLQIEDAEAAVAFEPNEKPEPAAQAAKPAQEAQAPPPPETDDEFDIDVDEFAEDGPSFAPGATEGTPASEESVVIDAAPAAAPVAPAPKAKPEMTKEEEIWLHELKSLAARSQKGDLLQILGVDRNTNNEQVQNAYNQLVKKFHPDRLGGSDDKDLQEIVHAVFVKIQQAYATLGDQEKRKNYLKTVALKPGEKRATDPHEALIQYEKARVFVIKKNYPEAVKYLRMAHELHPDKADYQAHLLWYTHMCEKDDREISARHTVQELNAMLQKVPGNFFVHRYLSYLHRQLKEIDKYEHHLGKANSIRPTDIDTARELKLHNSRKEKAEAKKKFLGIKFR